MGRVFVAGSINMDVVATADRHPRIGETIAGKAVLYFPGGKGANQAVAAAKLGAPTTLIGRLGQDAFGDQLKAFLATAGIDLAFVVQTSDAHTGTAIITVANADNTIIVIPGANAQVSAADVEAPMLAKGDIAVSQFEIPLPTITANSWISSIFSFSTRANSACWRRPSCTTPTITHASSTRRDRCKPARTKSFA
jgi:ribokinase